jgi:ABC-type amino acid transport system permease subunit
MVGFGPFAGFLTLAFATIGFLAKLLAEDIEDTNPGQVEAVRATGATWPQLVNYAVQPQVMPRLNRAVAVPAGHQFPGIRSHRHRRCRRHRSNPEYRDRPLRI